MTGNAVRIDENVIREATEILKEKLTNQDQIVVNKYIDIVSAKRNASLKESEQLKGQIKALEKKLDRVREVMDQFDPDTLHDEDLPLMRVAAWYLQDLVGSRGRYG